MRLGPESECFCALKGGVADVSLQDEGYRDRLHIILNQKRSLTLPKLYRLR
jgi:hypothetical protein